MSKRIYVLLLALMSMMACISQSKDPMEGLWLVNHVQVGEEEMTPISRWTELHADGSFETGNGWLQNGDGSWKYDPIEGTLSVQNDTGFEDPFGPFLVEFTSDSTMSWSREEEGMDVTVHYERVEEKPKAPADLVTGIWDMETATQNGEDVTDEWDPEANRFVFLRWDDLITDFTADGRVSGVWRVNAHRPVLDVVYYDEGQPMDYWNLAFEGEDRMSWEREGLLITFSRLRSFPNN